ncbi:hypothetical protein [Idiomarina abyssalis]|uniref:hypothetical protein n=1 Tax=Idiomarina abyssalis TaxID=86102 RepID=UPI003A93A654
MKKVVLIHATQLAMQPICDAFEELWPDANITHLLDEELSIRRSQVDELTSDLYRRVTSLVELAMLSGADAVMFTCSAFGDAIEHAKKTVDIPVLKPNEAMFEEAIKSPKDVILMGTFPPAMEGMAEEFRSSFSSDTKRQFDLVCLPSAREVLKEGRTDVHNDIHLQEALKHQDKLIMLAHFSSSVAKPMLSSNTTNVVLSAPHSAVKKLKERLLKH